MSATTITNDRVSIELGEDGVADVRPFGAMEKTIVEGVY
jgi:hypothetical protein